jgi:Domain of unknown function (DUF4376)
MTPFYITYNGVLRRYGTANRDDFSHMIAPDETIHEGEPPPELLAPPVEPPVTLQQYKQQKWRTLINARTAEEYSTFVYSGNTYDCGQQATQRIQGACQLALVAALNSAPFSIDWTLADDSVVTLDGTQMIAVGQALAQHVQTVHAKSRTKRQALNNALSFAEVDAITW